MWSIHLKGVAYTSSEGGVYVLWGWRIHTMGMAYTSNGGGVYVQWTHTSKGTSAPLLGVWPLVPLSTLALVSVLDCPLVDTPPPPVSYA